LGLKRTCIHQAKSVVRDPERKDRCAAQRSPDAIDHDGHRYDGENAFISFDDREFIAGPGGTIGAGPINDEGVEQWTVNATRDELKRRS
jgi:hypothetical protein